MGRLNSAIVLKIFKENRSLQFLNFIMTFGKSLGAIRRFNTSALRRGGDGTLDHVPPPGHTVPFKIGGDTVLQRASLTVKFILFFGSGLAVPWLGVRHHFLKK